MVKTRISVTRNSRGVLINVLNPYALIMFEKTLVISFLFKISILRSPKNTIAVFFLDNSSNPLS